MSNVNDHTEARFSTDGGSESLDDMTTRAVNAAADVLGDRMSVIVIHIGWNPDWKPAKGHDSTTGLALASNPSNRETQAKILARTIRDLPDNIRAWSIRMKQAMRGTGRA